MEAVVEPEVQQINYITSNLADLEKMAYSPKSYKNEIENCFDWIMNALEELGPCNLGRWVLYSINSIGLRRQFDEWCDRENRDLPQDFWGPFWVR